MACREGLSPNEIANLLRELPENESDGVELSCSNSDSDEECVKVTAKNQKKAQMKLIIYSKFKGQETAISTIYKSLPLIGVFVRSAKEFSVIKVICKEEEEF
ncbi:hypothetical protein NPIL_353701 [Nephila pilipes]|uniref:Uncharacterized protein n=1 Tax=Nephila pilipes TaxID=299642 RepID=A0A8X6QNP1_NEPPI|nr:hypothetical protein NPIL_353701 [Nephila pilipes]